MIALKDPDRFRPASTNSTEDSADISTQLSRANKTPAEATVYHGQHGAI